MVFGYLYLAAEVLAIGAALFAVSRIVRQGYWKWQKAQADKLQAANVQAAFVRHAKASPHK